MWKAFKKCEWLSANIYEEGLWNIYNVKISILWAWFDVWKLKLHSQHFEQTFKILNFIFGGTLTV